MPEQMVFRPKKELMQDDELFQLMHLFTELGFDKFRLTGGEPTVRVNIVDIVAGIAATPGVETLTMTTNGVLLGKLAEPLKKAGLQRVNVSMDTPNPERFKKITRWGSYQKVWDGILAAEAAGLAPMKLNSVVVRGMNDEDVTDMAALTMEHPWQVRFIEMMPFAGATELQKQQVVKKSEIIAKIEQRFGKMEDGNSGELDGEARIYHIPGAKGEVGFISSVSVPFCASCSRARLTADGKLRLCLLRDKEVDLLTPLRAGATIEDLRKMVLDGIWDKPWGHGLKKGEFATNRIMSEIGG
jgi:cyclic pyranopterin phosphate synthase